MDALNKIKHRQLSLMRKKIFSTLYAFAVDIYRPYKDVGGSHVLEDEILFEEEDTVGRLVEENQPISYTVLDTTKAVRCKLDEETGKVSNVRSGEANEFEPDKNYQFLIESDDVPTKMVMQFEVSTGLEKADILKQTITLIKVGSTPLGQPPYADFIHNFVVFHGDFT